MARLNNVSGNPVDLYASAGEANSYRVGAGEIVEVPGECADPEQLPDAYSIGDGDDARLWPKSAWELTKPGDVGTTSGRTPAPKSTTTGGTTATTEG